MTTTATQTATLPQSTDNDHQEHVVLLDSLRNAQLRQTEFIGVVGLGYVGLPLAIELADKFENVVGFDISLRRVTSLLNGLDQTGEIDKKRLLSSELAVTNDPLKLADATFYIVTVPTPIDANRQPDLALLRNACRLIGSFLNKGNVVVFESTVYPGVTEDICVPILEAESGLKVTFDFNIGYSPERTNPGDRQHPVNKIVKLASADTTEALERVASVYEAVIGAGVFRCQSIKVAEAAKVLENTQRDVNIALMNEMAMICGRLGINTHAVIDAASTKWNFQPYTPGLVGGHCISVDPYYLSAVSEQIGYQPRVIQSSRRVNESVAHYIATEAMKQLAARGLSAKDARVGVFGLSFKENVPDLRNSKTFDIVAELQEFSINSMVHDPIVNDLDVADYGIQLCNFNEMSDLDIAILCVGHKEYVSDLDVPSKLSSCGALMDVKSVLQNYTLKDGQTYWSL